MEVPLVATSSLVANQVTLLFTVPTTLTTATLNVRLANRNSAAAKVGVAFGTGSSPLDEHWISPEGQEVGAFGIREEVAILCAPGTNVWAVSDNSLVSVRVHGVGV